MFVKASCSKPNKIIVADLTRLGEASLMVLKLLWVAKDIAAVFTFDSVGIGDEVSIDDSVFGVL
jgi:hypothetical protein